MLQNAAAARRHISRGQTGLDAASHRFDQLFQYGFGMDSALVQRSAAAGAAFQQQTQQQMFAADVGVTQQASLRKGKIDRVICTRGESAESKHSTTILTR